MAVFEQAMRVASCTSPYKPRTQGPHAGAIVRDIAICAGLLKQDDPDELPLPLNRRWLRMAIGFAWEWLVAHQTPAMVHQPGEMVRNGIAMNPDGVTWMQDIVLPAEVEARGVQGLLVEESKCTWLSVRRDLRYKWIWMAQAMAYARGLGTRWVRFHVCYVNGDYRGSGPIYMVFWVQFTRQELDTTWSLIRRNVAF